MKTIKKIKIFGKAQVSAFIGGIIDYLTMIFFTEVFHFHYTVSIVIGGIIGSVINFSLNKKWSFISREISYKYTTDKQILRFVIVVLNSIFMKDIGTYIVTNYFNVDYKISRIIVDLTVSLVFNYTLQKNWVFKKTD
jgi:putative flippase GtrA